MGLSAIIIRVHGLHTIRVETAVHPSGIYRKKRGNIIEQEEIKILSHCPFVGLHDLIFSHLV